MTNELGNFLKACRARRKPDEVGIPTGHGVRRTPGLRREEVAALTGISADYYTRLEQGRERHPSDAVLDALVRGLLLDATEHQHLHNLARHASGVRHPEQPEVESVRPSVLSLLGVLGDSPAYVLNRCNDVVASNPAGQALLAGIDQWPEQRRNTTRYLFLHPSARTLMVGWPEVAQNSVADLRARFGDNPADRRLKALVDELMRKSEEFPAMWSRHEVQPKSSGVKDFDHPAVGPMSLTYEVLSVSGADHRIVVYQAEPGTPDHDAVALLNLVARRESPAVPEHRA
ncbi:helix-turn-helix transcriptional regulator [Saccharopolyspora sp. WRP15-2]|uniref:Helix-turn-helix transcriptional regulator n=1 Tax=Saccharopolyspora oryzae TaxID=2997343 RepID=A0ABT4V1U7_9PSEU|nr:helix-turn-helix transcriptional regulator [Saccharopolyspora oryzae]MDA3627421.1 helix-turn-helix transcriptional regulator [Saccharopolyspora oryzae]